MKSKFFSPVLPTTFLVLTLALTLPVSARTDPHKLDAGNASVFSCIAFADAATGSILKQEGTCDRRATPASTFKIALSLMGFDSGFLIDEHRPELPFLDGYPDQLKTWRAATDPTSWIRNSVIWYSWQVAESLGEEQFKGYTREFHYGNEDVSGNPGRNDGLTHAWLTSSLKISPLEQLDFLLKVVGHQLPVSDHAYEMTDRVTAIDTLENGWDVHGKTGTGWHINEDGSVDHDRQVGWFVGWATRGERKLLFVRFGDGEKHPSNTNLGPHLRESFLKELPRRLDSL